MASPASLSFRREFRVLDRKIEIACDDSRVMAILADCFPESGPCASDEPFGVRYRITAADGSGRYRLVRDGAELVVANGLDALVFELEHDFVLRIQHLRSELLFVHAAVLERQGSAFLLVANSGHGKSTTAWGLLHHGFRYLSDELAPVDVGRRHVFPFPRALCLKRTPPPPYAPPAGVVDLGRTVRIPAHLMPLASSPPQGVPIRGVLFVQHEPERTQPELRSMNASEAAARLHAGTLNALAHPNRGLDAVLTVVGATSHLYVLTGDLALACNSISEAVDRLNAESRPAT